MRVCSFGEGFTRGLYQILMYIWTLDINFTRKYRGIVTYSPRRKLYHGFQQVQYNHTLVTTLVDVAFWNLASESAALDFLLSPGKQ